MKLQWTECLTQMKQTNEQYLWIKALDATEDITKQQLQRLFQFLIYSVSHGINTKQQENLMI